MVPLMHMYVRLIQLYVLKVCSLLYVIYTLVVKSSPTVQEMQEMQIWPLGQEDPLEKEMATHSRILAWRIP